jgi:hypothetical protein
MPFIVPVFHSNGIGRGMSIFSISASDG